ncbi:MAG: DUF3892 domain-containing protein [Erysipelotrichales bacterium]|nr:DUF3892 domain-containing protein [Erysipelotrichales bacterium]
MATSKKESFVAVRKNSDGNIVEFKSSSGKVYDYEMAVEAVEQGKIEGCMLFTGRDGKQKIRTVRDDDPSNNLDNLKEF